MFSKLLSSVFAPQGKFPPCGMFTPSHLIAATIAIIVAIVLCVVLVKKSSQASQRKLYKTLAIVVTILETTKITHSFIHGYTHLDAWVPISYCSLFIYSLWMAGFGKGIVQEAGEAFITYGCPIAGLAFLIFPTTSLMNYPIWHFLSLYSMIFHTAMFALGLLSLCKTKRLTLKAYLCYVSFLLAFSFPAIILNITKGSNLMNMREPYNIPIRILQNLYKSSTASYTIVVLIAYILIPFLVGFLTRKIKFHKKSDES